MLSALGVLAEDRILVATRDSELLSKTRSHRSKRLDQMTVRTNLWIVMTAALILWYLPDQMHAGRQQDCKRHVPGLHCICWVQSLFAATAQLKVS